MTDKIKNLADVVAAQSKTLDNSIAAEREAEASLLEAVIENVRPALRALSSRLMERREVTGNGEVLTVTFLPFRGLRLVDNERLASDGKYDGASLAVAEDGTLTELIVGGHQSGPGGGSLQQWAYRTLTPDAAAKRYSVRACIDTLVNKLEEYADGNATKTAAKATAQVARLRAVITLLKH